MMFLTSGSQGTSPSFNHHRNDGVMVHHHRHAGSQQRGRELLSAKELQRYGFIPSSEGWENTWRGPNHQRSLTNHYLQPSKKNPFATLVMQRPSGETTTAGLLGTVAVIAVHYPTVEIAGTNGSG